MTSELGDYADRAMTQWMELGLDIDPVPFRTGIRLERLARRHEAMLNDALDPFRPSGIRSMEDFRLLALLVRAHPRSYSSTAASKLLGLSKAATSARIERLTKAGLIERAEQQFDKRAIEVVASASGIDVAKECVKAITVAHQRLLSVLTEDQMHQLDTLLGDITTRFI